LSRGTGIVLFSGGLDSLLAARILMDQDLDIIGYHCILPFVAPDVQPESLPPLKLAAQIHLPVVTHRCDNEYIDMIRNPAHGYGKRANPCIDCHIYFIQKAADYMHKIGAEFVATGEVVGQRPMSQMKHTMNHIEKAVGLAGRLLRPLSAKLLKPTQPEMDGIIKRDMLLGLSGRGRRDQFELAEKYGIHEYSSPSGGCLFTDTYIARRVKDLLAWHSNVLALDMYLLTIGRHLRISERAKAIISRNEQENNELEKYRDTSDLFMIPDFKGPSVYVKGDIMEQEINQLGTIMRRYGKPEHDDPTIEVYKKGCLLQKITATTSASDEYIDQMRI
jgi:tRNA-uridine 2-sulfurtransferase